jgi:hypothetical protein
MKIQDGIRAAPGDVFGVWGWRCSNKAKYIGNEKVDGSIHGRGDSFDLRLLVTVRLWLLRYDCIIFLSGFVLTRRTSALQRGIIQYGTEITSYECYQWSFVRGASGHTSNFQLISHYVTHLLCSGSLSLIPIFLLFSPSC